MITPDRLREARVRIAELFEDQCRHGAQTKGLVAPEAACGQFIGSGAKDKVQRGVYGTASALRVLAGKHDSSSSELIPKLVSFLRRHLVLMDEEGRVPSSMPSDMTHDAYNTVKLAEVLNALHHVLPAVCATDHLKRQLAERLMSGLKEGRGWGYFVTGSPDVEVLPTAYAYRALDQYGSLVSGPAAYLWESLRKNEKGGDAVGSDVMISVLTLYVLQYRKHSPSVVSTKQLKTCFRDQWARLESLMIGDIEQNIEYYAEGHTKYVRVPWQLYLLSLASSLRILSFASSAAQRRLTSIVDDVLHAGFVYPHSGEKISARTNAILFETIDTIIGEFRLQPIYQFAELFDKVRILLGSRLVALSGGAAAFGFIGYSVFLWFRSGRAGIADLAPNFVAGLVMLLLAIRKSR